MYRKLHSGTQHEIEKYTEIKSYNIANPASVPRHSIGPNMPNPILEPCVFIQHDSCPKTNAKSNYSTKHGLSYK